MADISKITLPDSSEYNIKDATARSIANGKSTVSVSQTLTSGTEIGSVTVDGTATKLYAPQGGTQNTWYGTCPTGAGTQTKVVTTSSRDFNLKTGSMVRVQFTYAQTYNGGIKLNVDATGEKNVMRQGTTETARYFFLAGEIVDFVYDGANYIAVNEGIATTTYYGVTKLSSATNSTSAAMAATPAAVKAAYDHASSKQDALVSGTNIKTINGESLLGSGDITVGATAMTDEEINTAVDDAFPQPQGKIVTVSLTNPRYESEFRYVHIYDYNEGMTAELIGTIESATGSLTVATSKDYLKIEAVGSSSTYLYENQITVTGGVAVNEKLAQNTVSFVVDSDGTITIDGINYDW